ncbi:MAG: response regulator transcription factor [Acidimicrobiia bacterium]
MTTRPIRILCVDDHAFLIDGLQARFALERDVECVGRRPSAKGLVAEVKRSRPDIVLMDIEMPGPDPFEVAKDLRRQCPEVRTIILSAYVRDHYIKAAFDVGCWGYLSKSDDPDEIMAGIRKAARGEFAFGPKVQERCRPAKGGERGTLKLALLTSREQEVLRLIGRGMSRADIAKSLSRSPKTVDGHRESIMGKLDIHDRGELVRFAIREGMAEP